MRMRKLQVGNKGTILDIHSLSKHQGSDAEASLNGSCSAGLEVGDLGDELDGSLAGEEVVMGHAGDGDHGETAVLDLSNLAASKGVGVVLEAKGIEADVASAVDGSVPELEEEGELEEADEEENLPEGARLDGGVVEPPHLLALVPLVHEGKVVEVLDDGAGGGEHADTSVLDLSLAGPDHVADLAEDSSITGPVRSLDVPRVSYGEATAGDD
eukprot:767354-Hanusia_phi.AAC.2